MTETNINIIPQAEVKVSNKEVTQEEVQNALDMIMKNCDPKVFATMQALAKGKGLGKKGPDFKAIIEEVRKDYLRYGAFGFARLETMNVTLPSGVSLGKYFNTQKVRNAILDYLSDAMPENNEGIAKDRLSLKDLELESFLDWAEKYVGEHPELFDGKHVEMNVFGNTIPVYRFDPDSTPLPAIWNVTCLGRQGRSSLVLAETDEAAHEYAYAFLFYDEDDSATSQSRYDKYLAAKTAETAQNQIKKANQKKKKTVSSAPVSPSIPVAVPTSQMDASSAAASMTVSKWNHVIETDDPTA